MNVFSVISAMAWLTSSRAVLAFASSGTASGSNTYGIIPSTHRQPTRSHIARPRRRPPPAPAHDGKLVGSWVGGDGVAVVGPEVGGVGGCTVGNLVGWFVLGAAVVGNGVGAVVVGPIEGTDVAGALEGDGDTGEPDGAADGATEGGALACSAEGFVL